jgi:hypothetical protein
MVHSDLVVELGEGRSGPLRDVLAATLAAPTLQIGYPVQGGTTATRPGAPPPSPAR